MTHTRIAHPGLAQTSLATVLLIVVAVVSGGNPVVAETVIYVDRSATGPVHDGSTWCAAFLELYDALEVAAAGDTIRIGDGIYKPAPSGLADPAFAHFALVNGVRVEGGYAGCGAADPDAQDTMLFETVLSGDFLDNDNRNGSPVPEGSDCCSIHGTAGCDSSSCEALVCQVLPDCCVLDWAFECRVEAFRLCCPECGQNATLCDNVHHVVVANGTGSGTEIDGLTISGGFAHGAAPENQLGGGLYTENAQLAITNCTFESNTTIIAGGGACNTAGSVVSYVDSAFQFNDAWGGDGFAVLGGGGLASLESTVTVDRCLFADNAGIFWHGGVGSGGGMVTQGGLVSVRNSTFESNTAYNGGATLGSAGTFDDLPLFENCEFRANNAGHLGGAVKGAKLIQGCLFEDNVGGCAGGGAEAIAEMRASVFRRNRAGCPSGGGGGARWVGLTANCLFEENDAMSGSGGGVLNISESQIVNSLFLNNTADRSGGGVFLNANDNTALIANSLFVGNSAGEEGGAIGVGAVNDFVDASISNCTFYDNHAVGIGGAIGGMCVSTGTVTLDVSNSILWANTDQNGTGTSELSQIAFVDCDPPAVDYSCIDGYAGALGGTGNIGLDPLFQDAAGGNLRLSDVSPCVDAAANFAVPFDVADFDGDGNVGEKIPVDLSGYDRFFDWPATVDTGLGTPPIADMGAYELVDCNNNGSDDFVDTESGLSADCQPNAIPDECETDSICGNRSRYAALVIDESPGLPAPGPVFAIMVTLVDIDDALGQDGVEGQIWWAGPSQTLNNAPNGTLNGAQLLCEATPSNSEEWPSGVLHLFGAPIVPGSTYEVRMCDAAGANCSEPLTVGTGKWGDAVAGFGGAGQPNFADITALVDRFKELASAPDVSRTDLVPEVPNQVTNFADISADVDAFKGSLYPNAIPACP